MQRQFFPHAVSRIAVTAVTLFVGALIGFGCGQSAREGDDRANAGEASPPAAQPAATVQRFGAVIGLKAEKKDYYNKLHAEPWPEINATLKKCNIRNYSIYEGEVDGKLYLFAYYEYTGNNFQADMAQMKSNPKFVQWWAETDPCQIRLPGTPDDQQWLTIPEVYHLD